jgi:hypothetical protein
MERLLGLRGISITPLPEIRIGMLTEVESSYLLIIDKDDGRRNLKVCPRRRIGTWEKVDIPPGPVTVSSTR